MPPRADIVACVRPLVQSPLHLFLPHAHVHEAIHRSDPRGFTTVHVRADHGHLVRADRLRAVLGFRGRAFFRALLAREPQGDSVGLILAVSPGNGLTAAESFPRRIKYWHGRDLPPGPITPFDKEALHARARLLEREVEDSRALFEIHAAELLYLFDLCGEPRQALRTRCRAAEIFYALGLVEDALDYGEAAWQNLRQLEDPEAFHDLRWALFTVLFLGHLGLGSRDEAERLARESHFLSGPLELPRRARLHHLMAALYAPHLEGTDAWHTYPGVRLDLEGLETRALAELAAATECAPW